MFGPLKKFIADLLFPLECVNCRRAGEALCRDCLNKIPPSEQGLCYICNRKAADYGVCADCRQLSALDEIYAAAKFKNSIIDKAIHNLKYNYIEELAATLANFLALNLTDNHFQKSLPEALLIPIPLHEKRYLERGFNQSELIAETLARLWDCQTRSDLLRRKKHTSQQALLNREARLENMKQAFDCVEPDAVKNRHIILIDDVLTSGATMSEAARELKKSGARQVCAVVLAHG